MNRCLVYIKKQPQYNPRKNVKFAKSFEANNKRTLVKAAY